MILSSDEQEITLGLNVRILTRPYVGIDIEKKSRPKMWGTVTRIYYTNSKSPRPAIDVQTDFGTYTASPEHIRVSGQKPKHIRRKEETQIKCVCGAPYYRRRGRRPKVYLCDACRKSNKKRGILYLKKLEYTTYLLTQEKALPVRKGEQIKCKKCNAIRRPTRGRKPKEWYCGKCKPNDDTATN